MVTTFVSFGVVPAAKRLIKGLGVVAKEVKYIETVVDLVGDMGGGLWKASNRLGRYIGETIEIAGELVTIRKFASGAIGIDGVDAWKLIIKSEDSGFDKFVNETLKTSDVYRNTFKDIRKGSRFCANTVCPDLSKFVLRKSSNYRQKLINRFIEEDPLTNTNLFSGLEANHRLPAIISGKYPHAVAEALRRKGISDINDPKIMEFIKPDANRKHWKVWDNLLKEKPEVGPDDIIETWKVVEKDQNLYGNTEIYRPETHVNP